jgi:hypothetical protein
MVQIHPSAQESFNNKADALVSLLKVVARPSSNASTITSEIPVAATITLKDIIGDIQESTSDYRGRIIEKFFSYNNTRVGLVASDYKELILLAESIQRIPNVRDKLSQDFIENVLFTWVKEKFLGESKKVPFVTYLKEAAKNSIRPITVYVPIASTVVQEPFCFCGVTIQNISKAMIDEFASIADIIPEEQREGVLKFHGRIRKEFQGRAAVKMHLECEPKYAQIISIEKAKAITDLLGIYSLKVITPDIKSVSKIKGTENIEQCAVFTQTDDGKFHITRQILDLPSTRDWMISKINVHEFNQCGLGVLSDIYTKKNPNDFESTILNMAYLYSKSAFTSDPMTKLVYILSALESTMLKNENEPIQQNLAERMAIFSAKKLSERKDIVRNVKAVYGLRSRYLHHGHTSSEMEQLNKFFLNVWILFVSLLGCSQNFKTKEEFITAIDDQKLS